MAAKDDDGMGWTAPSLARTGGGLHMAESSGRFGDGAELDSEVGKLGPTGKGLAGL